VDPPGRGSSGERSNEIDEKLWKENAESQKWKDDWEWVQIPRGDWSKQPMKKQVTFCIGSIGMRLEGNRIVEVFPDSQASYAGLRIGWIVTVVNGEIQPNNDMVIGQAIRKSNKVNKPTVILFQNIREVVFQPGKLGLFCEGNSVVSIVKRGQAERLHVLAGWNIHMINDIEVDNDPDRIGNLLDQAGQITISFYTVKKTCSDVVLCPHDHGQTSVEAIDSEKGETFLSKYLLEKSDPAWMLKEKHITDNECVSLSRHLINNNTLTILNLQKNKIGDSGAAAISEVLKVNTVLTSLDLRHNFIIGTESAKKLATTLVASDTIKTFSKIPVSKIKHNDTTLTKLSACNFGYSNTETTVLALILKDNTVVTSLDIRYNYNVAGESAKLLAATIVENQSIESFSGIPVLKIKENDATMIDLNLHASGASNTEAIVLGLLLKTNSTLTKLSLSSNKIEDIGAHAIAEGLKDHSTIKEVYIIKGNIIGSEGKAALEKSKMANTNWTTLE